MEGALVVGKQLCCDGLQLARLCCFSGAVASVRGGGKCSEGMKCALEVQQQQVSFSLAAA